MRLHIQSFPFYFFHKMNNMKKSYRYRIDFTVQDILKRLKVYSPSHPILVHFTIGLTASSFLFEILGKVLHVHSLTLAGFWNLNAATIITFFTILTGLISSARKPVKHQQANSFLQTHMALGLTFFGALIALTIWRIYFWQTETEISYWYILSFAIVSILMAIQGYLGGELVYRFGVEVKRQKPSVADGENNAGQRSISSAKRVIKEEEV